jgi:hypothetical protein
VRRVLIAPLAVLAWAALLQAADTDSQKAAATRKKTADKVSVEYKDTLVRDVIDDLNDKVPALGIRADTKGGVNLNLKVTYKAKDKPAVEVLNEICDKFDMGWYIIAKKADAYDGTVWITRGKERGYEKGKEPEPAAKDAKDKPDPKTKPDAKDKPDTKDKPDAKPKPAEDDPEQAEKDAARKLKLAKDLLEDGLKQKAKDRLEELIKKFPKTKAAEEAQKLLDDLNK